MQKKEINPNKKTAAGRATAFILMLMLFLCACGNDKINVMRYIDGEKTTLSVNGEDNEVVCVYTEYINTSGVPSVPEDFLEAKAYQDGTELPRILFERDTVEGYTQSNRLVMNGESADVVWIFKLRNSSAVEVKVETGSGTETYTIP